MHSSMVRLSAQRQHWFIAAMLLLFLGLSIQYSFKALHNRSAILRWRDQLQQLDAGENIYERYVYPNPPIMALMLRPLVELPPLASSLVWFYVKVMMTLLAFHWVFRMVETPEQPFPAWAKMTTVLLSLRPIMGDLSHGNVNLLILFLVVGSLFAFSRGRDLLAGTIMALAIACKVTPALFIPYFIWKRAWRTLAGCLIGLGLFFFLVPGSILGMAENTKLLFSWIDQMVKPFLIDGVVTSEHSNQSLPGLLYRLLTHSASFSTYDGMSYVPTDYHNFAALDPHNVRWLVKACLAVFAFLIVWTCRTPIQERRRWRLGAEFSLIVLGMLLFSERTWKHHCVTLLAPFAVLCYYLATSHPTPRLRHFLVGSLSAVVLLMATTSTSLLGAAKLAQVYGAYVWAHVILVAALVVILRTHRDTSAPVSHA